MTDRPADNQVCIGVGVRAHGIRGEVRLASLSEVPGRFTKGMDVVWRRSGFPDRALHISSAREQGGKVFLRFAEIADRTAAESLNGGRLWGDADSSPPLSEEDGYYHHQLLGLRVTDSDGALLGTLTAISESGAHDNYEVTMADGVTFLVPAVTAFVREINLSDGKMVIDPIPGLLPEAEAKAPRRRSRRRRAG